MEEEETCYPLNFCVQSITMLKLFFPILSVVRQHNFFCHDFGKCCSCQNPQRGRMPFRSYINIRKLSAGFIFHGEDSNGEYLSTQTCSLSAVSCPYRFVSYCYPVSSTRFCVLLKAMELYPSFNVFADNKSFKT